MSSTTEFTLKGGSADFARTLAENGFAHLPEHCYKTARLDPTFWAVRRSYDNLDADEHGGGRSRAHSRYHRIGVHWEKDASTDYSQSPEYNHDHGGIVRHFTSIDEGVLRSSALAAILRIDQRIAQESGLVDFARDRIVMGLHQIRYGATAATVSYSSPMGLHKDDEDLVFVHLIDLTSNAIGGDNHISVHADRVDRMYRLTAPLETLALARKVFHGVTPLGSGDANPAHRDVLLVTFQKAD